LIVSFFFSIYIFVLYHTMPRRLMAAQLAAIRKGGLFSAENWSKCISYLFRARDNPDPVGGAQWEEIMIVARHLVDWIVQQCGSKYKAVAEECLRHAGRADVVMLDACTHEENSARCVFSHRQHTPCHEIKRLHRGFYSWSFHPERCIPTPVHTPLYVYEAHYDSLIEAVYALGHLPALLLQQAKSPAMQKIDESEFIKHEIWTKAAENIAFAVKVVFMFIDIEVI
jgi:hypothetical protein